MTSMSRVHIESVVFTIPSTSEKPSLKLTAMCYTPARSDTAGLTLLCAHGAGTHKEQWEPTLDRIFSKIQSPDSHMQVREAWSVDWQSHGMGAIVNEAELKNRPGVSVVEWADAIAAFVRSPHLRGHRIVAIGHSAGSSAVVLSTQNLGPLFVGMILVEPVMCSRDFYRDNGEERRSALDTAIMIVNARRTTWPSREDAFSYMRKNFIWKGWDQRVLRTYTEHGMKKGPGKDEVILATSNKQEISAYVDVSPHLDAVDQCRRMVSFVPVHCIYGERNDLVPVESQESIFGPSQDIRPSSVQRVRRAGHMVLQENPDGLADAISVILAQLGSPT
ncbi:Alpha/beta hydrolase fold-1 [Mycena rebaudengoi]|nr:Alpha/beta hydrolase fold-1 [Mycena rebaudengoi]